MPDDITPEDEREGRLAQLEAALWRELQAPATQSLATIAVLLSAHTRINEELRFGPRDSARPPSTADGEAA
jgi:hypothetical protein